MEDIGLLKSFKFFRGLTTLELAEINKLTERVVFRKGETVIREGEPCESMFIVKEGSVRVEKAGRLLTTLESGSPIGEIAFVDKMPRSATVTADADSALIRLPVDALERLLERNPQLGSKVYKAVAVTLCERLRDATDTLLLLSEREGGI